MQANSGPSMTNWLSVPKILAMLCISKINVRKTTDGVVAAVVVRTYLKLNFCFGLVLIAVCSQELTALLRPAVVEAEEFNLSEGDWIVLELAGGCLKVPCNVTDL